MSMGPIDWLVACVLAVVLAVVFAVVRAVAIAVWDGMHGRTRGGGQ